MVKLFTPHLILFVALLPNLVGAEDTVLVPVEDLSGTGSSTQSINNQITSDVRSVQGANVQLLILVENLQQEVAQLRGQNEEIFHQLRIMNKTQKDRYVVLDRRLVDLSTNLAAVQQPAKSVVLPSVQVENPVSATSNIKPISSSQTANNVDGSVAVLQLNETDLSVQQDDYKAAFNLIRAKQYQDAIKSLSEFVVKYPQSDFTANAFYWLGEVHLVQKQPKLAVQSFEKVLSEFPEHRKVADAMYKSGRAWKMLGDEAKGESLLKRVIIEHPQSSAARLASQLVAQ